MSENKIEVITNQREVELLEKNRKINIQKLFTPEGMNSMLAEIEKEVADFSGDITTKKGQAEIKSMAAKVAFLLRFLLRVPQSHQQACEFHRAKHQLLIHNDYIEH